MRLLQKTTRLQFLFTLLIMVLAAIVLLIVLKWMVNEEIDEQLMLKARRQEQVIAGGQMPTDPFTTIKLSTNPAKGTRFSDTLMYDPLSNENETYRTLSYDKMINGQLYHIWVATSRLEWEDFYKAIFFIFLGILLLLLITTVIIQNVISRQIWKPFFQNLNAARQTSVKSQEVVKFAHSNIQEFREQKEMLEILIAEARKEYRLLRTFSDNASHEIQTPLAIILSKLDRLSQHPSLDQDLSQAIHDAWEASIRLSKINRRLLLLTKLDNRQFSLDEDISMPEIIRHQIAQMEELFQSRNLKIKTELGSNFNLTGNRFLPEMDEGEIVLDYNSPSGTSIEETDHILTQVDSIVLRIPEVVSFSRRTGAQMGFFITEPNRGDYLIELDKNRKRSTSEVIADIRQRINNQIPNLTVDFGQVIGDMLGDLMTSVQPIKLKIFGSDRDKLESYAKKIAGLVEKVPGTADVFDGIIIAGPNITVYPKLAQLALYGLDANEMQYQVQTAMQGTIAGSVVEKQQMTDIRMIYQGGSQPTREALRNMKLVLPKGKYIPLTDVATIEVNSGVAEQDRENLQPIVAVTSRLEGRDLGSVMKDIKTTVGKNVSFEKGYGVIYGGSYAQQQQSFKELMIILILASLLVLLVQMVLFRNIIVSLIILFVSLIGTGGSIAALFVTHTPLSVGSYMGIIMIVGIIAENAIFTYHQYQVSLEDQDRDMAINQAVAIRLRPNLMTALGAITALMPLALGIGAGAQLHQPLAIAVIGGFIVAIPLLLVVFPSVIRITKQ